MTKPKFEIAVGFFVVIGFVILSIIVFFVSGIYFFRPGYHINARFDYVGIINKGAPVRFSGVNVGEVSKVTIIPAKTENEKAKVEIKFFVVQGVQIMEHYKVSVQGTHIMSEPHIEITPVPGVSRILKDGDTVPDGVSPATIDDIVLRAESISKRMDELLGNINGAFQDSETQASLKDALKNMNQVLTSFNTITTGHEKDFRDMVINLSRVTEEMTETLKRINRSEGTIGKLISEDEIYNDLRDLTKDIKTHPWKLLKKS